MPTFRIPVVWQVGGTLEIEAENEEDAINKAYDSPLPSHEYICGSFEVEEDCIEMDC